MDRIWKQDYKFGARAFYERNLAAKFVHGDAGYVMNQICIPTHDMFDWTMSTQWGSPRWARDYHKRDWTGQAYWNVAGRCANNWGEVDDEVVRLIRDNAAYCKAPDRFGFWGDDNNVIRYNMETGDLEDDNEK